MANKTQEYILKMIRYRNRLDDSDTSIDDVFDSMTPHEKFREVIGYKLGDPSWADAILQWANDCGFKITVRESEK